MTMAHNIAATHRLEPIAGYDEITHLQYTGPMKAETLNMGNGSGEEPGLPSGSVVALDKDGNLKAGAVDNEMPMFLLWNTSDPDGFPAALTANKKNIAGIPMTGGSFEGDVYPENNSMLRQTFTNLSGGMNSLSRGSVDNGTGLTSYTRKMSTGNFTAWPATCGLEVTSTEFDFSIQASDYKTAFAPNTLLTSPLANPSKTINESSETVDYQQRRGGYLTPLTMTGTAPKKTATGDDAKFWNVCGTVSRGIHRNENGVDVLYFWAERTLIPASVTTSNAGTGTDNTGTGTDNTGTGTDNTGSGGSTNP